MAKLRKPASPASRPTILDVARKAGVSVGTVSNVLNGSISIRSKRKTLVMEAIAELGFVTNIWAQGIRRRRTKMIGLCVPNAAAAYFSMLSESFEAIAAREGFELMHIFSHMDGETELRRLKTLLNFKPSGLLLFPSSNPRQALDFISSTGVPTVILDRPLHDDRFDEVSVDARKAAATVTRDLIERGHRSILFLMKTPALLVNKHRIEGIKQAIRQSKLAVTLRVGIREDGLKEGTEQLRQAFSQPDPPTAIVASHSVTAAQIIKSLNALGVTWPADISLVVVDEPDWAELVSPTLSVVRQPTNQLIEEAWRLLSARINGHAGPAERVRLDAEVRIGGSVGPVPLATPLRAAGGKLRAIRQRG